MRAWPMADGAHNAPADATVPGAEAGGFQPNNSQPRGHSNSRDPHVERGTLTISTVVIKAGEDQQQITVQSIDEAMRVVDAA